MLVYVDPQRGLNALRFLFPGIEIDVSGANDKLSRVDIKIRRLKDIVRSVIASLPWTLPTFLIKDLAQYSVSRMNVRRTTTLASLECPRVRFTGRKVNFKKEFSIQFGDYCELPIDKRNLKGPMAPRTESAIALYPVANANNSWTFLILHSKARAVRSSWIRMVTTDTIIKTLNSFTQPVAHAPSLVDADSKPTMTTDNSDSINVSQPATHAPGLFDKDAVDNDVLSPDEAIYTRTADDADINVPVTEEENACDVIDISDTGVDTAIIMEDTGVETAITTRSGRPVKPPSKLSLLTRRILTNQHARRAIVLELLQMFIYKKALKPVRRSLYKHKVFLRSHMLVTEKFTADGSFDKTKARLVCDGRDQVYMDEIYSPTGKLESLIICLTAKMYKFIMVIDVKGAYLEAAMDEEVYMILDEQLTTILLQVLPELAPYVEHGKLGAQLLKALYCCKQSAKLWYQHLLTILLQLGFSVHPHDPCVLVNGAVTLTIYVDDMLLFSNDEVILKDIATKLTALFDELKCSMTNDFSYLGMHISVSDDEVIISMEKFIDDFIQAYGELAPRSYVTPTLPNFCEINTESPLLPDTKRAQFHTIVAKLLYVSRRIRLDLLFAVSFLCTRVQQPTAEDWYKLCRVIGYIKRTRSVVRVLTRQDHIVPRLEQYVDASFGIHHDGKSHTGSCIFWGSTCISASSCKQKMVGRDSTEAELIGVSDKVSDAHWCTEFLVGLNIAMRPPIIYQDSQSCLELICNTNNRKYRSKHLRVRRADMHNQYEMRDVFFRYCPTEYMIADANSKSVESDKFYWCIGKMMPKQSFH